MHHSLVSIFMAGGLGKRMSSTTAKVLHEIRGKAMIHYVIQNALDIGCEQIFIVVGKYKPDIEAYVMSSFSSDVLERIVFVSQNEIIMDGQTCSLGTGDAIRSCLDLFPQYNCDENTNVVVLSGDVPFIDLHQLSLFSKMPNSIMVANVDDPTGYGRVFLNDQGSLSSIVEHALCNKQQLLCQCVNAGVYNLSVRLLNETIPNIELNVRKKEFLLTDFYLFTDVPISCFVLSHVPRNVNTLTDLQSI